MRKVGGLALVAVIALSGCAASAAPAPLRAEAVAQVKTEAQSGMIAELRPLLKSLNASDVALFSEGYGACANMLFRDKDAYRESLLKQYESDLALGLDHLTVAAAAKKYLCP